MAPALIRCPKPLLAPQACSCILHASTRPHNTLSIYISCRISANLSWHRIDSQSPCVHINSMSRKDRGRINSRTQRRYQCFEIPTVSQNMHLKDSLVTLLCATAALATYTCPANRYPYCCTSYGTWPNCEHSWLMPNFSRMQGTTDSLSGEFERLTSGNEFSEFTGSCPPERRYALCCYSVSQFCSRGQQQLRGIGLIASLARSNWRRIVACPRSRNTAPLPKPWLVESDDYSVASRVIPQS